MLKAKPRRIVTLRAPARALVGTVATAAVLMGVGVVLPVLAAPLLNDDRHPVPVLTVVQPGEPFESLPVRIPAMPATP